MPQQYASRSPEALLWMRVRAFAGLFGMVGLGAFLGNLAEARRWHMALARCMGGLARAARLPETVGLAMPAALLSNAAANGMLVSSHKAGDIDRSALIAGGMANSYLAYASHSIRVMYPVIGAVGLPGALYFGGQLTGGFLVILAVLFWNRRTVDKRERRGEGRLATDPLSGSSAGAAAHVPLAWGDAARRALSRAAALLFRMACITVPLALGAEWLLKTGAFDFWEELVPERVSHIFPAELMSIVAAQMGGLVQSASLAAHLRGEGLIDDTRILLAMLTASAVGNPFRMLRRNLPSALGLFPPSAALTIVLGMQAARFVTTLALIALVILFMPMAGLSS